MNHLKTTNFGAIPVALALIISLFIQGCIEDDHHAHPEVTIDYSLTYLSDHKTFMHMDTVKMHGNVSANVELHGYTLTLKNITADTVVYSESGHLHHHHFAIDAYWVNQVKMHSDMRMTIEVATDHEGSMHSKSIDFHCHPMK